MSTNKISVIMLTYNRENLVAHAIQSILKQTLHEFEFIIIDNGSTDKSGTIADEYAMKDSRIRVIHRGGGNIGSGRNIGLDAANGEYIAFIDDDDIAEMDFLEFLYGLAIEHNAEIAVCGSNLYESGKILPNHIYSYNQLYILNAEQATEAYLRRVLYNAAMPTKLIKRSMFDNIRFQNTGCYDDITTTYRYFANANVVVVQGTPKYTFYRHSGNNSSAATKHHMLNPIQLNEYLMAFRERTEYIGKLLPQLEALALYSEWSYMISMVEKIHRYGLTNCNETLKLINNVLNRHRDDFINGSFIQEFEKKWMKKYIK